MDYETHERRRFRRGSSAGHPHREKIPVGEWVRRALRQERLRQPVHEPQAKLRAVRKAAEHSFPSGDIEQMLTEIERGYNA